MITATVALQAAAHRSTTRRAAGTSTRSPRGSSTVRGLISKHFIWSESGWAGGVYQWRDAGGRETLLQRAVARRHRRAVRHAPEIEFYEVFALTDNARGTVELFEEPATSPSAR